MSANIFGSRFLGAREPAWHGLGNVFTDPISASEAVVSCKLDYKVTKLPLTGLVQTELGTQLVTVDNKVMIAREPTADDPEYRYFGVASPDYGIIQNIDVARALDKLTKEWPVETVGALGKGETIFITLDAGITTVAGEEVHEFFLVTDTKDGGTTLKIAYTPVRVVCQNTLVLGLKQATISASLEHTAGIEGDFAFRVGLVDQMNKVREQTVATFNQMAQVAISDDQVDFVLNAAYPNPRKPKKMEMIEANFDEADIVALGQIYTEASEAATSWEYYCNRASGFRSAAKGLFDKINTEHPNIANTPWAIYNAIVECADYRNGSETVSESSVFGPRAQEKRRAYAAAVEVTTVALS